MKQNLLEPMLESLTRDEKVQLLQLILKDVGNNTSGIESQQGVCGGVPVLSTLEFLYGYWFIKESRVQVKLIY